MKLQASKKLSLPHLLQRIAFCCLFIAVILATNTWFEDVTKYHLNPDELVWTGMTEFYLYRKYGIQERFALTQSELRTGWGNQVNILTDQPQLGKYIFGFILDINQQQPWYREDISWVYQHFSQMKVPQHLRLADVDMYLGTPLQQAITTLRWYSTIIGYLALSILSIWIGKVSKQMLLGLLFFLFLITNHLIFQYFHLALTDATFFFFSVLFLICFHFLFLHFHALKYKMLITFSAILGFLAVAAMDTKLNGGFFFLLTGLQFAYQTYRSVKNKNQKDLRKLSVSVFTFSLTSSLLIAYLEPYLLTEGWKGVTALYSARFQQQERFFLAFGKLNWLQLPGKSIQLLLQQYPPLLKILVSCALIVGVFIHIRSKKTTNWYFMTGMMSFFLLANWYYARTGFDRYFIPTLIICLLITSSSILSMLKVIIPPYETDS